MLSSTTTSGHDRSLTSPEVGEVLGEPSEPLTNGSGVATAMVTTEFTSRTSSEPIQTDLKGRYVGPASRVSFLL